MDEYYDDVTIIGGAIKGKPGEILEAERQLFGEEKTGKYRILRTAACGHIILSQDDLGGVCQYKGGCGLLVCRMCTKVCARCQTVICPKHTRISGGYAFCPRCWWIVFFFGFGGRGGPPRENEKRGDTLSKCSSFSRRLGEALFGL